MRPHNSGHWTIEGARTSQFEQHLRAVLDYPLGATAMTAPVVVMANVLGGAAAEPRLGRAGAGRAGAPPHGALARREAALVRQGPAAAAASSATSPRSASDLAEVRARAVAAARYLADGVVDPAFAFDDDEH